MMITYKKYRKFDQHAHICRNLAWKNSHKVQKPGEYITTCKNQHEVKKACRYFIYQEGQHKIERTAKKQPQKNFNILRKPQKPGKTVINKKSQQKKPLKIPIICRNYKGPQNLAQKTLACMIQKSQQKMGKTGKIRKYGRQSSRKKISTKLKRLQKVPQPRKESPLKY